MENLLAAWQEFILGKRGKFDVQEFDSRLMENIFLLHEELAFGTYRHGGYQSFYVVDPKRRHIHKASVRDRLLHHAVHSVLYSFFDRTFIADSFSCRVGKGTHKAMERFRDMANHVGRNHTKTCWVLKCDIRKFFASIDHAILMKILSAHIPDGNVLALLHSIIESFETAPGKGLPLGNLTSQLFANIYLNQFDQFVKHRLRARYYIRYADDFVLLSEDHRWLSAQIPRLQAFLCEELHLTMHPDKIFLQTLASGVDFLGWVHFTRHRVLRTATKRRMLRRLQERAVPETLQSYLGLLRHGNTFKVRQEALNQYWLWGD